MNRPLRHCRRYVSLLIPLLIGGILLGGCAGSSQSSVTEERIQRAHDVEPLDPIAFQHFSVGTIALSGGDLRTAISHFQRALRFDPDSYEIRMTLADAHFRATDYDEAVSTAMTAVPRDLKVLNFLGKCYRYTNRNEDAARTYREIVEQDTTDASAYWYLARLYERQGAFIEAATYLQRAAELRASARYFQEAGDLYSRGGEFERARDSYDESIVRDSSAANRKAIIGKAHALEALGLSGEALKAYQLALDLEPTDINIRKRLINHYLYTDQPDSAIAVIRSLLKVTSDPQEETRLGVLLYGTGKFTEAEAVFEQLREQGIGYVPLYYLGRLAQNRELLDTAKAYYRQAIAVDDSITDSWIALMSVLLTEDSTAEAVAVAEQALERTNDGKSIWFFLGATAARRQSYDSALVWLRSAHALDSTDSRVEFALGSALERAGRFAESALTFSRLIRREPTHAPALNYLGYMYADSGIHLEESLELIERAIEVEPANPAYLDSYGWVLYRLGRLEEAEEQMRKALVGMDSDPVLFEHLGDILAARGKDVEARQQWEHALEIDPQNLDLRAKLKP